MLKSLILYDNRIGDAGLKSFADALGRGALPQLVQLGLYANQIGDAGMKSLSEALGRGALPTSARPRRN